MRTRSDEDCTNYKEALNAATTKSRKSNRSSEQQLACNINKLQQEFYAKVRNKKNMRDQVGPLDDSSGNIISQGYFMAEDLNGYFSSVSTS